MPVPTGLTGPRLLALLSALLVAMSAALFAAAGGGEEGAGSVIRWTARTTALLLLLIFPASALHRRWRSGATRWWMQNRRALGLSLTVSHSLHLAFILWLAQLGALGEVGAVTLYGGGWGYVLIYAMALTSNDASVRALGPNWRRLHLLGLYTLWIIYAFSYLPVPDNGPLAPWFFAGLIAVMIVRWWPAPARSAAHS
jgi:DMSO/TMAO reductase YedYZ heme-binding membrane subunit